MCKTCVICGKSFMPHMGGIIKTCSKKCSKENAIQYRKKYNEERRIIKTCVVCNTEFYPMGKPFKTCSDKCSEINRKKVAKEDYRKRHEKIKICIICNKSFSSFDRGARATTCSDACSCERKTRYQLCKTKENLKQRNCIICNENFFVIRRGGNNCKTCSDKCAIEYKKAERRRFSKMWRERNPIDYKKVHRRWRENNPDKLNYSIEVMSNSYIMKLIAQDFGYIRTTLPFEVTEDMIKMKKATLQIKRILSKKLKKHIRSFKTSNGQY